MVKILNRKDIILVPFPFSDLSNSKTRPALVLSKNKFNKNSEDIIVCAITSNLDTNNSVFIEKKDWQNGNYSESVIKYSNLITLDKKLVIKQIGILSDEKFEEVLIKIKEVI
ncbi:MAG: type II toxin-antitoxin system PemK/MazF family toxin [Candidatus Micrarchaeia archaeon]|jgi:mRNA interferase MazF